ncbi:spore germination protein [Alkaliphilus peptidifermentans]|uniref:GerA spore germination protein n=1 Tax=Alkaliphilus peptidifermentans DSM 18978 TaxID=1120976 RepID=A0A1G5CWL4_9FIRM|nr:spore germination protein [Alkaliphilus peptidifermentans]SCY06651.1 GerA spore germination protein [Alkaliphilus peptidifermentans DSM 18978]
MGKRHIYENRFHKRIEEIRTKLKNNYDIKFRELEIDLGKVCVIFCESITDATYISEHVIMPLLSQQNKPADIEAIKGEVLNAHVVEKVEDDKEAILHIVSGDILILFSFSEEVLFCTAKKFNVRAIEEPPTETVIKGPREGFNENLSDNISLVRKRIKNEDLKLERITIGKKNNDDIVMVYIEGVAPQKLVEYIRQNLNSIDIDYVYNANPIEEKFKAKNTPFDTVGYTEKPDIFVSKLVEGRVGIIINGTPFGIYAPYFFIENITMADDYYLNKYKADYFRIVRWTALFIALLLPGLYIAMTTHHFGLIPSIFVFRLAVLRAGVPFPTIVEVGVMMFFFQLLREAGVRLPTAIGPAISIVGALILGDAAIRSGLASEVTVLVIALSSISLFLIPKLHGALSIWTNILIFGSAILGLPGFYIAFILFCTHLAGLTSCGYPYLYPLGTLNNFSFGDTLLRGDLNKISNNILKRDDSP